MKVWYFYSEKQDNTIRRKFINKLRKILKIPPQKLNNETNVEMWKAVQSICEALKIPIIKRNKELNSITARDWNVHTSPTIVIKDDDYGGKEYCRFWGDLLNIDDIQSTLIKLTNNN